MSVDSVADERTMHEMYLSPFRTVVEKASPVSMMSSYNKINGVYASENKDLLVDILRKEWGFKGFVLSDWGAISSHPSGREWIWKCLPIPRIRKNSFAPWRAENLRCVNSTGPARI